MRSDILIKLALVSLIISGFVSPAFAYDASLFQWEAGTSGRLMRGEELSYNEYTVKVITFSAPVKSNPYSGTPAEPVDPFVAINLSKNGNLLNSTGMAQGDSIIVPDGELKLTVKALPTQEGTEWVYETYAPWVELEMSPRGKPAPVVSVETDSNEYSSNTNKEITASVTITNTGSADLMNSNMNILTLLPPKRGELSYYIEKLTKGDSITYSMTFATPIITELQNFDILANVTGYDAKDILYTVKSSKTITVAPEPEQIPTIKKYVNAKIYLDELAMVSLTFKNNANYELKNVSIADALPDGFKLLSNNSLHWEVTIPANGQWESRYLIKPVESNKDGVVLPPATADFRTRKEYYSIQSNEPSITVYGPKISLTKQTDISEFRPGDAVTVTVVAQNDGSTPTKVSVRDTLPPEGTLLSGVTSLDDFLEANKASSFSYTIRIDSDNLVKLPAAIAEYYELSAKSGKLTAVSGEPELTIRPPESEKPQIEETPQPVEIIETPPPPPPELPFTPIIEEDNVTAQVNISETVIRAVSTDFDSIFNGLLGCKEGSFTDNETYVACNYMKNA